jgi:hypothetical protein
MLYFREFELKENDQDNIEKRIRSLSKRRHSSLDIVQSVSYDRDGKLFLAVETSENITLTRLKLPIERFLPKIIVRFSKSDFRYYKIRLSLFSSIIFVLLWIPVFSGIQGISQNKIQASDLIVFFCLLMGFVLLAIIEIALTKRKLKNLEK